MKIIHVCSGLIYKVTENSSILYSCHSFGSSELKPTLNLTKAWPYSKYLIFDRRETTETILTLNTNIGGMIIKTCYS